jgi:F0F1-type ATP synthase assembly protein I
MPDDKPPKPGPSPDKDKLHVGMAWSLVFEFLGYMAILGYGGWLLDQRYGWQGRGLFVGLVLALAAWIYRVIRQTWHLFK